MTTPTTEPTGVLSKLAEQLRVTGDKGNVQLFVPRTDVIAVGEPGVLTVRTGSREVLPSGL